MLNRERIEKLIRKEDLIQDFPHLDTQLQPNGFDLTVDKMFRFNQSGKLDFSNSEREIPDCEEIEPQKKNKEDKYGWWELDKGTYKIRTNERFKVPKDLAAVAFPRSSLLRMGCSTQTGVWDAGFTGKADFILRVNNPHGVEIKENGRVAQVVFLPVKEVDEVYKGVYNE